MSNTTSVDNPILAARKISPLRQRMIDDMTVRNFAPNTILCYLKQVSYFSQHFGKSPNNFGPSGRVLERLRSGHPTAIYGGTLELSLGASETSTKSFGTAII